MKIKTKLALSMGAVFVLFCAAIAAALVGMQSTKVRFERFLQEDLELLQAATGMYAEGLQTGQALRNIVLDPANKTAYKNLEQAAKGFEQNGEIARRAATDPADLKVVEDILALRQIQVPIQSRIAGAAAADQAGAIKSINDDETPAWRAVRGRLLDFIKVKKAAVEETKERMAAFSQQMLLTALAMVLAAVVIGAGVMYWLGRHLMRQLGGEPAYAVDVARAIAEGDLSRDVVVVQGDSASMLAAMGAMRANLTSIVHGIRLSSESIATASGQIASGNQDLSQRTEEQAASLEETAASMEELTGTVKQNAENAQQANQLAHSASDVAVKGGSVVGQVVETMAGINAASRKIADIITVIDGIAFQTNILAL
ncbi:MAG TPA: methyl-accepting chemotaxis protein, partial [Ramlibacter sp.]